MAEVNIPSTMSGMFKQVYGSDIRNLLPKHAKIQKAVRFVLGSNQLGDFFNMPVVVTHEHGITYGGSAGGHNALNASVAHVMQNALVKGSEIMARSKLSYGAAARSVNSKAAFARSTAHVVKQCMDGITKRVEAALLYGSATGANGGIGAVDDSANVSATSTVVTLNTNSWAPGMWTGSEGASIQFRAVSNNALLSSGADSIFTISAVSNSARTLTVTGTATGITALDGASADTQYIVWYGAYGNEMTGLQAILPNTGSLFNIDAASYSMWAGNTYDAAGQLTYQKVLAAVSKGVDRGLDEDVVCFVNPHTFTDLSTDVAGGRRLAGGEKMTKFGTESIQFLGQNGVIDIQPYAMIKEGLAFVFAPSEFKRVGSTDVTVQPPGRENVWIDVPDYSSYELRSYTDQAIFTDAPAKGVLISGIVNVN